MGQHQMLTWYLPFPRRKMPESESGNAKCSSLPAMSRACVPSEDVHHVGIHEGRCLDAPVNLEHEIAQLAIAPKGLVTLGFARGVVVNDAVHHFPVAVVAIRHLPAGEVLAVKQGGEAGGRFVVAASAEAMARQPCRPIIEEFS